MYFGNLKKSKNEQGERDHHACIYDLNSTMKWEQHNFPSLELKLNPFLPDPIKSLVFGEINSKWAPQVFENIALVNYFSILD